MKLNCREEGELRAQRAVKYVTMRPYFTETVRMI